MEVKVGQSCLTLQPHDCTVQGILQPEYWTKHNMFANWKLKERKGLLTPSFYLLVTLVNDLFFVGEEGVSKTICSYDITI